MDNQERNKVVRKWIRENGAVKFDFKNKDIILEDGLLFSVDKEIKKLPRIKAATPTTTTGLYKVDLTKVKYKTECYNCRIWFEELEEMLDYLNRLKMLLNSLGYKTTRKIVKAGEEDNDKQSK